MPRSPLTEVVHRLGRLLGPAAPAALTDAVLVERFVRHRDEAAFAALVERHGPLVLGVCRQVLQEECAAEDAFQATFLVLARKAGSLRAGQAVGSWLYRVALNLARTARTAAARRQSHERQTPAMPSSDPFDEVALREVRPMLHEEIGRLPEKYRLPVLLCHLEGRTHEQAAEALGWPVGTVRSRLSRGRDLLRRRLERRGVTTAAVVLAALLGRQATAAVPTALASLTVRSALPFAARQALPAGAASTNVLNLAEEALRAMTTNNLKRLLAFLLMLGIAGTGAGVLIGQHVPKGEQAPANAGQTVPDSPRKPGAVADGPAAQPPAGLPPDAIAQLGKGDLRHAGTVETYAFTPDGKTLVTASSDDGAVHLWDTGTGQHRARFELPPEAKLVRQMIFSPNGKVLAITGQDQAIRLWDLGGTPLHVLRWPAQQGDSPVIAFNPDGKKLASWTNDFTVRLWDVGTGGQVGSFVPAPDKAVRQLVYGRDNTALLMVFDDGKAQLWDPASGKKQREFHDPRYFHWCYAAAVSPDGKTVATGGISDVCLWESATGRLRERLTGYKPKTSVLALAFSPDGLSLSTASDGGECRVWRVADGKELHQFQLPVKAPEVNPVRKLVFSRDGATLAWNHWRQHEWIRLTDVKTGKERGAAPKEPAN
jgi:RNA polymerase sigma factor (sigma-70 family)